MVVNPRYKKIAPHRHFALYGDRKDYMIPVDCGRCINCFKKYLGNWRFRLLEEFKGMSNSELLNSYYITFTIAPKYYSEKKAKLKKMVRLFLERVRQQTGKSPRHFFVTERGEEKDRLHFHGFLFNINFSPNLLSKFWFYGFVRVYPVLDPTTPFAKRVAYCTTYITKGKKTKTKLDTVITPEDFPLILVSPGLGASYVHRKMAFHHQRGNLIPFADNDVRLVRLPRYLRQKVFSEKEQKQMSDAYFDNLSEDVIPDPPYFIGDVQYNDYSLYLQALTSVQLKYKQIYGT